MTLVHGTIERSSIKPGKTPGWYKEGWLVNGNWYNRVTKFPKKDAEGKTVEFQLDNNPQFPNSIAMNSVKFITKASRSTQVADYSANKGPRSQDNGEGSTVVEDEMLKRLKGLEGALKENSKLLLTILERLDDTGLIKSTPVDSFDEETDEEVPF